MFKDQGLQIVGVDPGGLFGGDTPEIVTAFREQTGATFPVGWDKGASYTDFRNGAGGSISPFPLDVIVGRDGVVEYINTEYEPQAMRAVIERLLATQ